MSNIRTVIRHLSTGRARKLKSGPSFEEFIFMNSVKNFYRKVIRTAYRVEDPSMRASLIEYAKGEFKSHSGVQDLDKRKYILAMGQNHFRDTCKQFQLQWDFTME